jgi:hypothetical protein
MTKRVEQDHASLLKQFKEKIVVHPWFYHDCEPTTKWQQVTPSSILGFFSSPNHFLKDHDMQKRFLQNIMLFVIKGFLPLRTMEFVWFQRLVLQLYPKVSFLSKRAFTNKVFPKLVNMALTKFMQLALAKCLTTTYNFDLWMSKRVHDVFVVVVNFLFATWKPKHIMIGLLKRTIQVVLPWL